MASASRLLSPERGSHSFLHSCGSYLRLAPSIDRKPRSMANDGCRRVLRRDTGGADRGEVHVGHRVANSGRDVARDRVLPIPRPARLAHETGSRFAGCCHDNRLLGLAWPGRPESTGDVDIQSWSSCAFSLRLLKLSAWLTPFNPEARIAIARLAMQPPADEVLAVKSAESASRARYVNNWTQVFEIEVFAGSALLKARRSNSELDAAMAHLTRARHLWEHNARHAVDMYYNIACTQALRGESGVQPFIALFNSVALAAAFDTSGAVARDLARQAAQDEDLVSLKLQTVPNPSPATIAKLNSMKGSIEDYIQRGLSAGIQEEELKRFVALYIRRRASEN